MGHYYSKVDADDLLSLVSAKDCVEYFSVSALVSEMNDVWVLDSINESEIISYLEDKGFTINKEG